MSFLIPKTLVFVALMSAARSAMAPAAICLAGSAGCSASGALAALGCASLTTATTTTTAGAGAALLAALGPEKILELAAACRGQGYQTARLEAKMAVRMENHQRAVERVIADGASFVTARTSEQLRAQLQGKQFRVREVNADTLERGRSVTFGCQAGGRFNAAGPYGGQTWSGRLDNPGFLEDGRYYRLTGGKSKSYKANHQFHVYPAGSRWGPFGVIANDEVSFYSHDRWNTFRFKIQDGELVTLSGEPAVYETSNGPVEITVLDSHGPPDVEGDGIFGAWCDNYQARAPVRPLRRIDSI